MAKQKEITYSQLNQIKPVTDSQKLVFDTWKKGQNNFYLVVLELEKPLYHYILDYQRC